MNVLSQADIALAADITRAASHQTYLTVRYLVDGPLVGQAYAAYAYFRWVDDTLDAVDGSDAERVEFVSRQQGLLEAGYRGQPVDAACSQERLLAGLIAADAEKNSGLQSYLRNMMAVMDFDVQRRGRLISQAELTTYTRRLAVAVTEAMHFFIGHNCATPHTSIRYQAVSAAHITHMLRDTFDDLQAGYYNVPREVLEAGKITPEDVHSGSYRAWVSQRADLAQRYFTSGRIYLGQLQSARCRMAGFAYTARFERLLRIFAAEDYRLRPQYSEACPMPATAKMYLSVLGALIHWPRAVTVR